MSLVLRYVDSGNNIVEDLVKFIHNNNGLDGESLSINILDNIASFGLDISNCRGQGYDGAGAVAGIKKGVAARILKLNNKALYTHCFSHRLNLAVCNSCKVRLLSNAMDHVKEVSYYFNLSIKRNSVLETF